MSVTSSSPDEPAKQAEPRLNELKSLLLSDELERLQQLQQQHKAFVEQTQESLHRIKEDSRLTPERLAEQLPEAVLRATHQGEALNNSLAPTIEESIKISVTKNPKGLVNAIFPILGPAIRKAISSSLYDLMQSFNHVIEQSISWKGLKWRLESIRTGKPFADIVLLHSLLYSVEQVFLIHKTSGLILLHETSPQSANQDPGLVSGMLTAIQDFLKDSFATQPHDDLESLRMGDLTIWIEPGPHAVIALVIRGNAPSSLRNTLQETVEKIHARHALELEGFSGNTIPFDVSQPFLKQLLKTQYQEEQKSRPPLIPLAIMAISILAIAAWSIFIYLDHKRWDAAVNELAAEPGIVILSHQINDKYSVTGLRDPLVADPMDILSRHGFGATQVQANWQAYHSLQPEVGLIRARQVLSPPASVDLNITADTILAFSGQASSAWIKQTQQTLPTLLGFSHYDFSQLINSDAMLLQGLLDEINSTVFYFASGKTKLADKALLRLNRLMQTIRSAIQLSNSLEKTFVLNISGYADSQGSATLNANLSQQRARNVRHALMDLGLNGKHLQTSSHILDQSDERYESGRRVMLKATLNSTSTRRP